MRGTKWAVGVVALLAGTVGPARGDDGAAYDLRGPAPEKGKVVLTTTTFKITGAKVKIKAAGQTIDAKQTLTATGAEEVKVLAVEGRQATKTQTKVTKEQVETVMSIGGQDQSKSEPGDLDGEVILSERTGPGKWKHVLVDTKPTEKQTKELVKRAGMENSDDLFPAEKVKPGHTWTVDATALQRVLGGSITDLKGKMKMTFVKVDDVNGEKCAVVTSTGVITGVADTDGGKLSVEMDMTGTTWRSVKTGLDVKDKAAGKIKMSGTVESDGAKLDLTLEGPFSVDGTAKFKAAKGE